MKKRILIAFSALVLLFALNTNMAFAGTLELVDSYPKDGGKGMQVENAGVKLYFNHDMSAAKAKEANENGFTFVDAKGKAIPTKAFYSPKEKGVVLVLVDDAVTLKSDSAYKLKVSKNIVSSNGAKLDSKKDIEIDFTTVNTKSAVRVNMVMMGIMMVAMVFMSSRANKIKETKDKEEHILEEKVNPYKIAKERGVPVETVIEELERKKEKARIKLEKKQAKMAKYQDETEDEEEKGDNKRVRRAQSAAAAQSKYVERLRMKKGKK